MGRGREEFTGETVALIDRDARLGPNLDALLRQLAADSKMETILISGGRKDKIRKGDILGALTGEAAGLKGTEIGRIEIQDKLSYVAVSRRVIGKAVEGLNKGRIKRKRFRATHVGGSGRR